MKGNLLGLLGICRKAGKIKLGFDPAAASLGKEARLLLFTADISPKTRERMLKKAQGTAINFLDLTETSDVVYHTIGKRVAVMAITDKGLADAVAKLQGITPQSTSDTLNTTIGQER